MGFDFNVTVNVHLHAPPELWALLRDHERRQRMIMATLDQVLEKVSEQHGTIESMKVFISALEQQVRDALSGTTLPPNVQAKVDAVFAGLNQNNRRIAAAIDNDPATTGEETSGGDTGGDTGGQPPN